MCICPFWSWIFLLFVEEETGLLIYRNMRAAEDKKFDFNSVIAPFGIRQQEFNYEFWLAISCN